MAQLSDAELKEIVRRDLPNHYVVSRTASAHDAGEDEAGMDAPIAVAEAAAPSLEALRRKYLPEDTIDSREVIVGNQSRNLSDNSLRIGSRLPNPAAELNAVAEDETPDDEIIIVQRKGEGHDAWDANGAPKVVVVSGAGHRIIGEQG